MPPEQDDTGSLERLRQRLYAPRDPAQEAPPPLPAAPVTAPPPVPGAAPVWTPPPPPPAKKRLSLPILFLILASVFFVVAVAAASYFLIFGTRAVSPERVVVAIDGDTAIRSGDPVTLLISVRNENPVPLRATSIVAMFPETARRGDAITEPYPRYEDTMGEIEPGATATRSVQVALFGAEQEQIVIPVRFEYRIDGSEAVFVREAEYTATITSSPLTVRAEAVSQISVGQPLTFSVTVRSHASSPVEHVAVQADYPFGFTPAAGQGSVFVVGTLAPGEERALTVSGTLTGEDADERVFRFSAGTRAGEDGPLQVTYATALAPVTLAKPFLLPALSFERDATSRPVIRAGEPVQVSVSWLNALPTPLLDGRVEVKLEGDALDPVSVSAYGGFYRSSDRTVIYSRETFSGLANLAPGATGSGTFSFRTKPAASLIGTRNPSLTATVSVSARRVGEGNVPEQVPGAIVRTIRIGTDLTLTASGLYSAGPFKNTGPWPPVPDQETTYTVDLSLANSVNSVADAVVSGTLPSYVRFTGATSPADGSISYNAATRTVSWRAGDVAPGAGHAGPARTGAFQVALLPSVSQRGTSPILMSSIRVTGFDRFTEKPVELTHPEVTTRIVTDPAFVQGKGEVR